MISVSCASMSVHPDASRRHQWTRCVMLALLCAVQPVPASPTLSASTVQVVVTDEAGKPVADAVASLHPLDAPVPRLTGTPTAVMDQKGLRFVPQVLPVQAGTEVSFPNSDNVRHQVYSFSAAKRFELRLYAGMHRGRELFDKPGVVVMGCNIHDWMLGYIYVVDTPWFARSDVAGRINLRNIPAGDYELHLWQPRMDAAQTVLTKTVHVPVDGVAQEAFVLKLHAPELSNQPPPGLLPQNGMPDNAHAH